MRRPSRPDAPGGRIASLLGMILVLLALSACAQRAPAPALAPPPPERPYWRVDPGPLENLPRLPSPADTFRA